MSCRPAVAGDAEGLARVWIAAWQAAYAGLMPAEYLASLDVAKATARPRRALPADQAVLVLELGGEIAGFARFGASRDPGASKETGEIMAINLHPKWWRQGHGRELLAASVARLAEAGYSEATLWVLAGNARARRFYESLGWTADGSEKQDDALTGFPLHEVRYRLPLPRPPAQ
ncbi:MAG TPA: GNAT family N-acetyltransferase, partial [Planctomycetota bacterium]|nr:GNAT family N-acetyltransferase [Planctomycetota bacterium]